MLKRLPGTVRASITLRLRAPRSRALTGHRACTGIGREARAVDLGWEFGARDLLLREDFSRSAREVLRPKTLRPKLWSPGLSAGAAAEKGAHRLVPLGWHESDDGIGALGRAR